MKDLDNKKTDSIRIRISTDMRDFVEKKSKITGKTISDIFRDYISRDMAKQRK